MKAVLALCVVLAGCATGPQEPIDPARAAIIMQMLGNQQAAHADAWQQMQSNPAFQRQQPLNTAPGPVRCVTRHIGGTSYTDCY